MARILVIDDEPLNRDLMKTFLSLEGHEVLLAENGKLGLEALNQKPDMIFLDCKMPVMDGNEFIKNIKENPEYSQYSEIPVIGISATGFKDNQYFMITGQKPIRLPILQEYIEKVSQTIPQLTLQEQPQLTQPISELVNYEILVASYESMMTEFVDKAVKNLNQRSNLENAVTLKDFIEKTNNKKYNLLVAKNRLGKNGAERNVGIEGIEEIRSNDKNPNKDTPCVLLSGAPNKIWERAIKSGRGKTLVMQIPLELKELSSYIKPLLIAK